VSTNACCSSSALWCGDVDRCWRLDLRGNGSVLMVMGWWLRIEWLYWIFLKVTIWLSVMTLNQQRSQQLEQDMRRRLIYGPYCQMRRWLVYGEEWPDGANIWRLSLIGEEEYRILIVLVEGRGRRRNFGCQLWEKMRFFFLLVAPFS
jgi:hypothetical protein